MILKFITIILRSTAIFFNSKLGIAFYCTMLPNYHPLKYISITFLLLTTLYSDLALFSIETFNHLPDLNNSNIEEELSPISKLLMEGDFSPIERIKTIEPIKIEGILNYKMKPGYTLVEGEDYLVNVNAASDVTDSGNPILLFVVIVTASICYIISKN